jgi:hypothetical protein
MSNQALLGVRVCNTGNFTATVISADFAWDTSDPYIEKWLSQPTFQR